MGYQLIDDSPTPKGGYTLLPDEPSPGALAIIGNAANKAIAGIPDSLLNTPNRLINLGRAAFGTAATALGRPDLAPELSPDREYAGALMRKGNLIRQNAEPTTAGGRLLDATVQGAVGGAINPSGGVRQLAVNAAYGGLAGAASDAVQSATGSEPLALAAGMLAPSAVSNGKTLLSRTSGDSAAAKILQSAHGDDSSLPQVVSRLRNSQELVPGSLPMTYQAAESPGLSQLARTVRNVLPGGGDLTLRDQSQNSARLAAVESVAPGAQGLTSIEAKTSAGKVFRNEVGGARQTAKDAVTDAYNAPVLNGAQIPLPGKNAASTLLDRFYPGRSLGADQDSAMLASFAKRLDNGDPVPLKEFDALRKIASNKAQDLRDVNRTASAAWYGMKNLFNSAEANAVTTGAGLSPEQATALQLARDLHQSRVGQFDTGPQRNVWKTGSDGLPRRDEAQIFNDFFNPGATQSSDINSFKKATGGNPFVEDVFRKAAMSDLLERSVSNNTGLLSNDGFQKWNDARSSALSGLLNSDQQIALGNVGADLQRAARADNFGRAQGSNTAQNLEGGLLFGKPLDFVAGSIPYVGKTALEAVRGMQRRRTANQVSGLLLDPQAAAAALAPQQRKMLGLADASFAPGGLLTISNDLGRK